MNLFGDNRYREEVEEWKSRFMTAVEPSLGSALMFSGGTDSICVLAAAMEMGEKPYCYHAVVDGHPSEDLRRAREMAKYWGFPLRVVTIPGDLVSLERDVRRLVDCLSELEAWNPARTTVIQCSHVMMYLAREISQSHASAVMGVGGVTDDTRKCAEAHHKEGSAGSDRIRRYTQFMGSAPIGVDVNPINAEIWFAETFYGLEIHKPYEDPTFGEYSLSLPLEVVNYPRMKGIGIRAFSWFWNDNPHWWKPNTNMHVGSGIRELHNLMVDSPLNTRDLKRTPGIYRDILKQELQPTGGGKDGAI